MSSYGEIGMRRETRSIIQIATSENMFASCNFITTFPFGAGTSPGLANALSYSVFIPHIIYTAVNALHSLECLASGSIAHRKHITQDNVHKKIGRHSLAC